jgi:hypothetical protein
MAKQTKELAVIDFEKFSIAQLPELQGKKEEIASVIKANPIVEIVDNGTYELAKKSRTAVRSLRTSLESEQKTVKKKIKERVLDVVDGEYNLLVTLVKGSEKERQAPIDTWETKKEEERLEKLRLEQDRIDAIKKKIGEFRQDWEDVVSALVFERIETCKKYFDVAVSEYNRNSLEEYEVLFDDAVSYLTNLLNSRISTLTEQEQIRIDNLLIQEKNAENSRIQEWQRTWNANIDTLSFDDIKDVKSVLVKSKLADLKHYSTEYNEIYTSTEKRLHSQIELISKAEEQRIAQEKFLEEKKALEEKQAKEKQQSEFDLKIKNRIIELVSYGLKFDFNSTYTDGNFFVDILDIKTHDDKKWDKLISDIVRVQKDIANKKTVVSETIETSENYHESDVDVKGVVKTHDFANYQEEVQHIEQIPTKSEVTWESIWEEYRDNIVNYDEIKTQEDVLDQYVKWLEKNYNVPTKKQ